MLILSFALQSLCNAAQAQTSLQGSDVHIVCYVLHNKCSDLSHG